MISKDRLLIPLYRHRLLLAICALSLSAGVGLSVMASHFWHAPPPQPPQPKPPITAEQPAPEPEALPLAIPSEPDAPPAAAPAPPPAPAPIEEKQVASAALVGKPAWLTNALPSTANKPMIAVIIDDMGLDRRRSAQIVALPGPLTISFMTYAGNATKQVQDARAHGHEIMMHMPMQPHSASFDAGPDVLMEQLPPEELRRRVVADLDRFSGYVGVNNHMGSRFTEFAPGMRIVMEELHKRGLLFVDSMTTSKSVGPATAKSVGVPEVSRDIFLDDVDNKEAVERQLAKLETMARQHGSAIAIGHPHDNTIAALTEWLPGLAGKGLTLVPVTAVVKSRLEK